MYDYSLTKTGLLRPIPILRFVCFNQPLVFSFLTLTTSLDTNTLDFIQASRMTMNGNVSLSAGQVSPFFPQIRGGNPEEDRKPLLRKIW